MEPRGKGWASWIAGGVWWIAEKLWGDAVFAQIRPMIPAELASLENVLHWMWQWGIPLLFVLLGGYFFWRQGRRATVPSLPPAPSRGENPTPPDKKRAERPSLLSLFMTDLQSDMSWNAKFPCELEGAGQKVAVDIFYRILDDFTANAKYVAFYVPKIFIPGTEPSSQTVQILALIAGKYQRFIQDIQEKRWAEMKSVGSPDVASTRDAVFSGRIFIYHADDLAVEQLAALKTLFQKNGAAPRFRGMDYASASWQSILLGEREPPPKYEVRDGWPRIVGEKTLHQEQS